MFYCSQQFVACSFLGLLTCYNDKAQVFKLFMLKTCTTIMYILMTMANYQGHSKAGSVKMKVTKNQYCLN